MVSSFIHGNLLSLPKSSQTSLHQVPVTSVALADSSLTGTCQSTQVAGTATAGRVSENIRVLYTSGFLLWQAAAILDQHPLSLSENLKKKRLTFALSFSNILDNKLLS